MGGRGLAAVATRTKRKLNLAGARHLPQKFTQKKKSLRSLKVKQHGHGPLSIKSILLHSGFILAYIWPTIYITGSIINSNYSKCYENL